jgi:hypothetical protein
VSSGLQTFRMWMEAGQSNSLTFTFRLKQKNMPLVVFIHGGGFGHGDHLVPFLQSERFVDAMEKAGAPFYFHTVVGGGHNPYFGLNFNSTGTNFEGTGGGIGLFEDPMVEPLIFGFFRHYLLEDKKDLFTGAGVSAN